MRDEPQKELEPGTPTPDRIDGSGRRSFLGALVGAGAAGMGVLLAVPLARFAADPLFQDAATTEWSDVGDAAELAGVAEPVKRTIQVERRDGWRKIVDERSVYIVEGADGRPRVLSTVCPHLGCAVTWDATNRQFLSPCHGGVFGPDGERLAGPPRRGLDEMDSKVENGHLLVRYQFFRPLIPTKESMA
jgi:menaquinol-cytochrome c reductase iron-sulfur subunit